MISVIEEPLIVGDEHNTARNLERTNQLYDGVEALGRPVIHLGDTFHTKEKVSSKTQNLIYKKLKESKLNHIYLVGNHDWHSLECKEHSLEVLKELPNVEIVDSPRIISVDNKSCLFMPYYHDLNAFKADLKKYGKDRDILFMHQGVTGFDYGNGFIAVDELDFAAVGGFKKVISGHFHKYQNKGNLVYLGTPHSNDFGESNQTKYIAILRDLELELMETGFPRHMTWEIPLPAVTPPYWGGPEFKETDIHRIILCGTKENIDLFPKDKYPGVRFIDRPINFGGALQLGDKLSNEAKFQLWAKDRIDNETANLGLEILTGVK